MGILKKICLMSIVLLMCSLSAGFLFISTGKSLPNNYVISQSEQTGNENKQQNEEDDETEIIEDDNDDQDLGGSGDQSGDQDDQEEQEENDNQEDPTEPDDEQNNPDESDDDEREIVYFTSINCPEILRLSNNGIGIEFILELLPANATEGILIEIEDTNIVNFASGIPLDKQSGLLNFTLKNNMLYPLSAGETFLIVKAMGIDGPIIKTCIIIVEEYEEEVELAVCTSDGTRITSGYKSGQKSNGEYEIYTAKVLSNRDLSDREFNIINSLNIVIIDDTKGFKDGIFSFDFYILDVSIDGAHSLKVSFEESYDNLECTTYSRELAITSVNFVGQTYIELSRIEGDALSIANEDNLIYLLYFIDGDMGLVADSDGFYHYYNLKTYECITDNRIFGVNYYSSNTEVAAIETVVYVIGDEEILGVKIVARGIGEAIITAVATDGSGQTSEIHIRVDKVTPAQLKIVSGDQEADLLCEEVDLDDLVGDFTLYELSSVDGVLKSRELTLFISKYYVGENYAYFQILNGSVENGLNIETQCSNSGDAIIKKCTFTASKEGVYQVGLIVDGELVYSFEITVLVKTKYFDFNFVNYAHGNVESNFINSMATDPTIIIDITQPNRMIRFQCQFKEGDVCVVPQALALSFSDNSYVEGSSVSFFSVCFEVKGIAGEFNLIITETYSGETFTLKIIIRA
jgi:hypothetical protein